MRKLEKRKDGITLISLVITIILLLILVVVTIANLKCYGILNKAKIAKEKYTNEQEKETEILKSYNNEISSTRETLTSSGSIIKSRGNR